MSTWTTARDAVLADATSAGTALAALYTAAKSALGTAQTNGSDGAAVDWSVFELQIAAAIEAAVAAGGVPPTDLRRILRFAGIAERSGK